MTDILLVGNPLRPAIFLAAIFTLGSLGCGTLQNGHGWGQDATLTPGWARIKQAALNAAASPATWATAAGGVALKVGNADGKITKWASEKTPVFGSRENAERMSDSLKEAGETLAVTTAVMTPSGDNFGEWVINKAKGVTVQAAASSVPNYIVGVLKKEIRVMRPNGHDNESFPSFHSMRASVSSTLASRNIESLDMSNKAKTVSHIGLGALTAATAWARVESNWHYPSDVLTGIAIGHFFGAFVNDAFLGIDSNNTVVPAVEPLENGVMVKVRFFL